MKNIFINENVYGFRKVLFRCEFAVFCSALEILSQLAMDPRHPSAIDVWWIFRLYRASQASRASWRSGEVRTKATNKIRSSGRISSPTLDDWPLSWLTPTPSKFISIMSTKSCFLSLIRLAGSRKKDKVMFFWKRFSGSSLILTEIARFLAGHLESLLRESVLDRLVKSGHPETVKKARELFEKYSKGDHDVPSEIRRAVCWLRIVSAVRWAHRSLPIVSCKNCNDMDELWKFSTSYSEELKISVHLFMKFSLEGFFDRSEFSIQRRKLIYNWRLCFEMFLDVFFVDSVNWINRLFLSCDLSVPFIFVAGVYCGSCEWWKRSLR